MKKKKTSCIECNGRMEERKSKTKDGFTYRYYHCKKCGEEILDMDQLHEVAEKYRKMKKFNAKISKWGMSLGLRIPKELVKKYDFKQNGEVIIIPEEEGIRIIPA